MRTVPLCELMLPFMVSSFSDIVVAVKHIYSTKKGLTLRKGIYHPNKPCQSKLLVIEQIARNLSPQLMLASHTNNKLWVLVFLDVLLYFTLVAYLQMT